MSVAVIYCQVFEREIAALAERFPQVTHRQCLDWGLHIHPDRLAERIAEAVRAIEDRVDAAVLGYGRCQAMDKLPADFAVPVFHAQAEDCIGVLLGPEGYRREMEREVGTFYLSPGWADMGIDGIFTQFDCDPQRVSSAEALQTARLMLANYRRLLFIDMPVVDAPERARLLDVARGIAADLDLRLDRTRGSLALLTEAFEAAVAAVCRSHSLRPAV